jgi:hypothetical protein
MNPSVRAGVPSVHLRVEKTSSTRRHSCGLDSTRVVTRRAYDGPSQRPPALRVTPYDGSRRPTLVDPISLRKCLDGHSVHPEAQRIAICCGTARHSSIALTYRLGSQVSTRAICPACHRYEDH